jgi:hypothetical protein
MQFVETPVQAINSSINLFVFARFLQDAVVQGLITPKSFQEQIRLDEGGRGVDFKATYSVEQLHVYTRNMTLMTLGTTAIAMNKALEVLYGKTIVAEDTSPAGYARVLIYQIRCAFAHDPLNPVWWIPNVERYNHTYKVTVKVNRPSGELRAAREINFHPPSLNNKHLSPADIGGLGGYLGLLHYYLAQIEAHPKGNQPYPPPVEES